MRAVYVHVHFVYMYIYIYLCMRNYPHFQFPFLTQTLQQVSTLATKVFQKNYKLQCTGLGLVHLPKSHDHQIKGGCSINS